MRTFTATAVLIALPLTALHSQTALRKPADSTQTFVAASVSYVDFAGSIKPWRIASLSVGHRADAASLIGTLNYGNRFSISGTQLEGDAYPRINATTYAYLNLGHSASEIFPEWRYGGEVFKSLPRGWEASVGFRELRFRPEHVLLATGTVGKYFGDYWVSARPYVRLKSSSSSASAGLTARRYFASGDHFVGARASYGTAPTDQITPDQLGRTRSYSADIHGSGGPWERGVATWSLGYAHEELSALRVRKSWTAMAGMKIGL